MMTRLIPLALCLGLACHSVLGGILRPLQKKLEKPEPHHEPNPHAGHHPEQAPHSSHHSEQQKEVKPSKKYEGQPPQSDHDRHKRGAMDQSLNEKQVSTNCRVVVATTVRDPVMCSRIPVGPGVQFNPVFSPTWGSIVSTDDGDNTQLNPPAYSDPNYMLPNGNLDLQKLPGGCMWDYNKAKIDPTTACLCLSTMDTCTRGRDGCIWYENMESGYQECISKAEKFYNLLYALLHKRGKKNIAINLRYGAVGARGELPYGPYGPAIIGYGNPSPSTTLGVYDGPPNSEPEYGPPEDGYSSSPQYGYSGGGGVTGYKEPMGYGLKEPMGYGSMGPQPMGYGSMGPQPMGYGSMGPQPMGYGPMGPGPFGPMGPGPFGPTGPGPMGFGRPMMPPMGMGPMSGMEPMMGPMGAMMTPFELMPRSMNTSTQPTYQKQSQVPSTPTPNSAWSNQPNQGTQQYSQYQPNLNLQPSSPQYQGSLNHRTGTPPGNPSIQAMRAQKGPNYNPNRKKRSTQKLNM